MTFIQELRDENSKIYTVNTIIRIENLAEVCCSNFYSLTHSLLNKKVTNEELT